MSKDTHTLVYPDCLGKKACPMVTVDVVLCYALIIFLLAIFVFFTSKIVISKF